MVEPFVSKTAYKSTYKHQYYHILYRVCVREYTGVVCVHCCMNETEIFCPKQYKLYLKATQFLTSEYKHFFNGNISH